MSRQSALENIQFVKDWFKKRQTSSVILEENNEPAADSNYETTIAGEIKFKPLNQDEFHAEIWFAENGAVGFGLERQKRIAELLGVSSNSKRFAGGKEPTQISKEAIGTLLTLIADGRIEVAAFQLPLIGLLSTRILAGQDEQRMLKAAGFSDVDTYFSDHPAPLSRVLRFARWT